MDQLLSVPRVIAHVSMRLCCVCMSLRIVSGITQLTVGLLFSLQVDLDCFYVQVHDLHSCRLRIA